MSVNLRILVPESTINYVKNPSPRYDLTGYTAAGATITRTLDRSRFSIASVKVVTAGSVLHEGFYYRVSNLVGISDFITASVYVRGSGKVRLRLINNPSGAEWYTPPFALNDDRWHRLEISGNSTGSDDMRLYVETDDLSASVVTFYADGLQMERKPYATTYCDGSREGCRWDVQAYATSSSRDATSRVGGRWVPLAGPCRPDNNLYVTVLGGLGMPPIENQTQPWSNASGSFFQDVKVEDRTLTLSLFAKNNNLTPVSPADPVVLHELRQQLIDIIKPDKTVGGEAFLLEYSTTESNRPLYIRARYDAGLEGSWDVRNEWVNSFPLRLLCVDPFWFEDDQEVASLDIKLSFLANSHFFTENVSTGQWNRVSGTEFSNGIDAIIQAPDGAIYVLEDNVSTGIVRGLSKWDGTTRTFLGSANAGVDALAVGPAGEIYVGGVFTAIGGIAANGIAKYTPSTNTWSALGTGIGGGGQCLAICVAPNGQVYIGGIFTSVGGVTCNYIARWDGSQWRTVGSTSGFNTSVSCIVNARDGKTLYVGGAFTQSNGGSVTYNHVASIDIETNLISQLGYGITGTTVNAMAVGLDGTLYAGGQFTASAAPGAAALVNMAQWSGGAIWLPMGSGLGDLAFSQSVRALAVGKNGELYASGTFTLSGDRNISRLAVWRKDTWNPKEVELNDAATQFFQAILVAENGDLYFGHSFSTAPFPTYAFPKTTSVNNDGTAAVFPTLYYTGGGTIRFFENVKTKQVIYLNLIVLSGEEIMIEFSQGKIISSMRGDLSYAILPGSDIRAIYLLPGENIFSALVINDVGGVMQLRYQPQHHSADAVVDAEEL